MSHRENGPVRMCVGCGARDAQAALLRFGTGEGGSLQLAPTAGRRGRSGYLHPDESCWRRFTARKGAVRSLRRSIDRETRHAFVDGLRDCGMARPDVRED